MLFWFSNCENVALNSFKNDANCSASVGFLIQRSDCFLLFVRMCIDRCGQGCLC